MCRKFYFIDNWVHGITKFRTEFIRQRAELYENTINDSVTLLYSCLGLETRRKYKFQGRRGQMTFTGPAIQAIKYFILKFTRQLPIPMALFFKYTCLKRGGGML